MFRQVDIALYESKKFSGTHFQLFDKQMEVQLFDRISLDKDMENGLERGEFVVYFQPQAYTKRMSVFGFEALVRWKRKGAGIVPPDQFISAAETSGFIQKLDLYVLQKACETAVGWAYDFKVSVNLSPLLFSNVNLPANIQNIIKSTGIDPSRLTLEITETALMSNREQTIVALNKLRELGLKIALDDFGTGYSSLSYLYEFPLDILKIDRAFVADLTENPTKQAIFKSIVELGQKLNLFVIVEGIETEEQRLEAARLGADSIQGYLLSKPFPNEQMTEKLVELMRNTTRTAIGSDGAKPENTEARATG
ncbi:MAG: EAL domain-containing protein [Cohaesibacteraceae bacterium]|nr:EAL domain-containing protein [Cohaesibacteraceae bacterium]